MRTYNDNKNFTIKMPIEEAEFIFSSLGACSTTIVYLVCAMVFDQFIKNYKISNFLALSIAIAMGYGIQKGVFTLRNTPPKDGKIKTVTKYLFSEIFGMFLHQLLFIQFLKFSVIMPVLIQNTLLRITCSSIIFFVLYGLRKYWVFM